MYIYIKSWYLFVLVHSLVLIYGYEPANPFPPVKVIDCLS